MQFLRRHVPRGESAEPASTPPPCSPMIRPLSLPAPSIAPAGVASAALYDLAVEAGLAPLRKFTFSVATESWTGPIFDYPEMYALSLLNDDERAAYHQAKSTAAAAGTLFMTRGHHCFVGRNA